jgi:hypothetical protein
LVNYRTARDESPPSNRKAKGLVSKITRDCAAAHPQQSFVRLDRTQASIHSRFAGEMPLKSFRFVSFRTNSTPLIVRSSWKDIDFYIYTTRASAHSYANEKRQRLHCDWMKRVAIALGYINVYRCFSEFLYHINPFVTYIHHATQSSNSIERFKESCDQNQQGISRTQE